MEREIMVIMELYKNIKTSVGMDRERLDEFVVKVGVCTSRLVPEPSSICCGDG